MTMQLFDAPDVAAGVPMKALSLWQPWASLIAYGIKTIETRSWATTYRGSLAIHAAKTCEGINDLPGDCEGKTEGGWVYGYIGDYQAAYCRRTSDEGRRGEAEMAASSDGTPLGLQSVPLPLGSVVATCWLVECWPTDQLAWASADDMDGEPWTRFDGCVTVSESQRPYGDYSSGRWAWLLDQVKPIDPPIPARGRQQLWTWTATSDTASTKRQQTLGAGDEPQNNT